MIRLNEYGTVEVDSLDVAEVIVAGLIKLGRLPEPISTRQDRYEVVIDQDRGGPFDWTIKNPIVYVRKK